MKLHYLKTWPDEFQAVLDRRKKHEFRKNDRGFGVGHRLVLQEWDPIKQDYTRREREVQVTYISRGPDYGIPDGYCVMSIFVPV